MTESNAEMREALLNAIEAVTGASFRWAKFADYEKQMCLEWIAAPPDTALREERLREAISALGRFSFDPMYYLGQLTFFELKRQYGRPVLLGEYSPRRNS